MINSNQSPVKSPVQIWAKSNSIWKCIIVTFRKWNDMACINHGNILNGIDSHP